MNVTSSTHNPTPFKLRSGESWRLPWDDYRSMRDHDPVHRVDHPELGEFWVLTRFADVFDAVRDTAAFSSAYGLTPGDTTAAAFSDDARPIVMMDPPDHTAMRRLVSATMTPKRVSAMRSKVEAFVDARLDLVADAGTCDIVDVLFKPLPSFVVAHYLGVAPDDRSQFDGWTDAIVAANASSDFDSAASAIGDLYAYGDELIELRRTRPGDDLVSHLVQSGAASAGWIVGFVFTMITGGNDTTTGLLGGAAELLTDHDDQRQELIRAPELVASSVDEFLRLTSPVQNLARTTMRDVTVGSRTIPAGSKVMLVYASANRDEREFGPTADVLDVHRTIGRIVSFGYGAHHCLGAAAARLQASVTLERLLARFPHHRVDAGAGRFAAGSFVRRYDSLPFSTQ